MSDELPEDMRERLERANASVLDRLARAGWAQSARNDSGLLLAWTDSGNEAAKQLGALFEKLGSDLSGDELTVLLTYIDTMSSGGGETAEESRL